MARGNAITGALSRLLVTNMEKVADVMQMEATELDIDKEWTRLHGALSKPENVAKIKELAKKRLSGEDDGEA